MQHAHYWYLLSLILFLLEATAVPGIGFFFAAFGALSLALLVQWNIIDSGSWLIETTAFFFLTGLWAAILWVPLQKFRLKRRLSSQVHHDVIGRFAIVGPQGLAKGVRGNALWSGTLISARLADDAAVDNVAEGAELKIVDIDGLVLVLAEDGYRTAETNS